MNKYCDLHTHSSVSDGTDTPRELVNKAVEAGLSSVALCDHNTLYGLPEFLSAAEGKPITAIPGAEFTVELDIRELHLLGLFIPERAYTPLNEMMKEVNERKDRSNADLVEALNGAGYKVDYDRLRLKTPTGIFNRAHVAEELIAAGYAASMKEAFENILDPRHGYYVEYKRIPLFEMIDTLKGLGAVPVLAHPLIDLSATELEAILPKAKNTGLAGIECYYSEYDAAETVTALKLVERFGLKPSGGSDYHGKRKPHIALGRGTGDLFVPNEWAKALSE